MKNSHGFSRLFSGLPHSFSRTGNKTRAYNKKLIGPGFKLMTLKSLCREFVFT